MEVAKLTAPITVKIPFQQIQAFQDMLNSIANTLDLIVTQFKDINKATTDSMKDATKGFKKAEGATEDWQEDLKKIVEENNKIQKEQKQTRKGATRVAKAWGGVANQVAKVRVGIGLLKFVVTSIIKVLSAPLLAGAGFLLLAARVNKTTSEMVRLSEATGMGVNDMNALALAAKDAGFTFEHVNSLIEEWNNKIAGEKSGFAEGQLREGLAGLGIALQDVIDLKPDKALEKIMNAGQKLAKEGRIDEFSSAVDKIYGQEANRLMTSWQKKLLQGKMTFSEMKKEFKEYVSLTERAQKGALFFTSIWNKSIAKMKNIFGGFFGDLGDRLRHMEKPFSDFIKAFDKNIGPLKDLFLDFAVKGIQFAFDKLIDLVEWLQNPVNMLKIGMWITSAKNTIVGFGKAASYWLPRIGKVIGIVVDAILRLQQVIEKIDEKLVEKLTKMFGARDNYKPYNSETGEGHLYSPTSPYGLYRNFVHGDTTPVMLRGRNQEETTPQAATGPIDQSTHDNRKSTTVNQIQNNLTVEPNSPSPFFQWMFQ